MQFDGKILAQGSLALVVLSALTLLAFGLKANPGPIEILHLPTTLFQLVFVFCVALQRGYQKSFATFTAAQVLILASIAGYMLLISTRSPIPSAQINGVAWVIHIVFFASAVAYFRVSDQGRDHPVWDALSIAALLHVFAFLFAWSLWSDAIRAQAIPVFENVRHLGYFLVPAAAVVAVRFVSSKRPMTLPLLSFAAATLYLSYTGSRGGAIALGSGLLVVGGCMVWMRCHIKFARLSLLVLVMICAVVVAEFLPPLPWQSFFARSVDAIGQSGTEVLNGRSEVWAGAYAAIKQNWIWGYGPAVMGQIPEYDGPAYRHPHNIVLQFLLHWGVVGTVLLLSIFAAFGANIAKAFRGASQDAMPAIAVLITMAIHGLVDGVLYYPFSVCIALIALAQLDSIGWRARQAMLDDRSDK